MQNHKTAPILFIPHGGGPLPLLGDPGHQSLVDFLKEVRPLLGQPAAVVIISAHWEERQVTITSGATPGLIYDYYGFPEASYQIKYPAPGHPALANKIFNLLTDHEIDAKLDENRGFDHGVFVPLKLMLPDATIPCVQISLLNNLDPEQHIRIGQALSGLLSENILVLGSGFSFHNMNAFFTPGLDHKNEAFESWLIETCSADPLSSAEREKRLVNWEQAPEARYCHPREEHLLPLHVCYGMANSRADLIFEGTVLNKRTSAFLWKKA